MSHHVQGKPMLHSSQHHLRRPKPALAGRFRHQIWSPRPALRLASTRPTLRSTLHVQKPVLGRHSKDLLAVPSLPPHLRDRVLAVTFHGDCTKEPSPWTRSLLSPPLASISLPGHNPGRPPHSVASIGSVCSITMDNKIAKRTTNYKYSW